MPPRPATTAVHVEAREARWSPSAVLWFRLSRSISAGLAEVVVRELEMAEPAAMTACGPDDSEESDGELLVVGEVLRLLLASEDIAAQVHRQHEIGLLHHLLAVQVEVREVQQQGILIRLRGGEVPTRVIRVHLALLVDAQAQVERDHHPRGCVAPRRRLLLLDAELFGEVGMAPDHVRRGAEVLLGHEVRVHVVVDERVVLVGTGDAVDAEPPRRAWPRPRQRRAVLTRTSATSPNVTSPVASR
jgi:hypothetical protein